MWQGTFKQSEGTAARRRVYFHLVDATDGMTPETGETAGQPQISKNGAAWGNTTATLTAIGNGRYYVELTATELDTLGHVSLRYKSANTAEAIAEAQVVAYDPYSAASLGLSNLDAAISTRLATAGYTAPLDAAGTRAAVGLASANLDTQLTNMSNLDATVSSRLATAGYTAPPSAATNATAVRTELTTELGRIDVAVSTRLATAGYTAPLDAAGTRTAIGLAAANLDTQLGAIDDYLDTEVAAIKAKTDNLPASPAATGDIPSAATIADAVWDEARAGHVAAGSFGEGVASVQGNVTGSAASVTGAVGSVAGAVGSVTAAVTVGTNNDKTGYRMSATGVDDILRTALTEGYASAGSTFTLEQAAYMLWQALQGFSISGTTITGKRLNGTNGMTWTLDSAVTPTSRVRAT